MGFASIPSRLLHGRRAASGTRHVPLVACRRSRRTLRQCKHRIVMAVTPQRRRGNVGLSSCPQLWFNGESLVVLDRKTLTMFDAWLHAGPITKPDTHSVLLYGLASLALILVL